MASDCGEEMEPRGRRGALTMDKVGRHGMHRSMSGRLATKKKKIIQVLGECDWFVEHVWDDLVEMDIVDARGDLKLEGLAQLTKAPSLAKSIQAQKIAKQEKKAARNEGDEVGVCNVSPYGSNFQTLHRNFISWRSVPPGWKRRFFDAMEDVALNLQQTKILIKPGAREPQPEICNQILIFLTDIDLDQAVGENRSWQYLCDFLCNLNVKNGRRGEKLRLTETGPDFNEQGLGSVDVSSNEFMVSFKCATGSIHLETFDDQIFDLEYRFRNNYSRNQSTLVITRISDGVEILNVNTLQLFTQHGKMKVDAIVGSSPAGKRKAPAPSVAPSTTKSPASSSLGASPSASAYIQSDGVSNATKQSPLRPSMSPIKQDESPSESETPLPSPRERSTVARPTKCPESQDSVESKPSPEIAKIETRKKTETAAAAAPKKPQNAEMLTVKSESKEKDAGKGQMKVFPVFAASPAAAKAESTFQPQKRQKKNGK